MRPFPLQGIWVRLLGKYGQLSFGMTRIILRRLIASYNAIVGVRMYRPQCFGQLLRLMPIVQKILRMRKTSKECLNELRFPWSSKHTIYLSN